MLFACIFVVVVVFSFFVSGRYVTRQRALDKAHKGANDSEKHGKEDHPNQPRALAHRVHGDKEKDNGTHGRRPHHDCKPQVCRGWVENKE